MKRLCRRQANDSKEEMRRLISSERDEIKVGKRSTQDQVPCSQLATAYGARAFQFQPGMYARSVKHMFARERDDL